MITMVKRDGTSTEIQPSSVNTEGVADPSTDTGANVQEVAEPATVTDTDIDTSGESSDNNDDGSGSIIDPITETTRAPQDPETNARYAAARRAAEKQKDQAVQEERTRADSRVSSIIKSLNLKDENGNLITTEEEYQAYSERRNSRRATEDAAAETGISTDRVDELVSAHPDVQAARDAQEQLSRAQEELMNERVTAAINSEIAIVRESFPEISSLDDIIRLPRYSDIKDKVTAGYTLSDAVRLTYEDVYVKRRTAAAAQQVRNTASSTAHLSATRSHGSGGINVTESQIKAYMDAIPGSTREQAIRAYKKYKLQ